MHINDSASDGSKLSKSICNRYGQWNDESSKSSSNDFVSEADDADEDITNESAPFSSFRGAVDAEGDSSESEMMSHATWRSSTSSIVDDGSSGSRLIVSWQTCGSR